MVNKIRFACSCGKSVSADAKFAGRKAKCPSCGAVLQIPACHQPKTPADADAAATVSATQRPARHATPDFDHSLLSVPAVPEVASGESSIWDEMNTSEVQDNTWPESDPLQPVTFASSGSKSKPGGRINVSRVWIWTGAFTAYCCLVWLISAWSPIASMIVWMPVFFVAILGFVIGTIWYWLVVARDDPTQARALFFAFIGALLFGKSATKAGYSMGRENRGVPVNPRLARPIGLLKLGGAGLALSIGTALIVGIILGKWREENLRAHRFERFRSTLDDRSFPRAPASFDATPFQHTRPSPPPTRWPS
jgi:hypothetical protein